MQFNITAAKRDEQGSGASRRLRHAGRTPGIIYGSDKPPVQISLDHNDLFHMLRNEAFHSSVLTLDVEGTQETAILRATQWHPYKQLVLHIDFQRVDATHKMHIKVPLHFINAEIAPGVKLHGGVASHVMTEIDVQCLPGQLPEFIEVDLKDLDAGQSIHVSQLQLPAGVEVVHHGQGEGDPVVASVVLPRGAVATDGEAGA